MTGVLTATIIALAVTVKLVQLPAAEPEPTLIDYLEGLLTLAQAGEICGIAAVVNHADNNVSWSTRGRIRPFATAGGLIACQFSVISEVADDPDAA